MEFTVSGKAVKHFTNFIIILARLSNRLIIKASSSEIVFETPDQSKSPAISFSSNFFDVYTISSRLITLLGVGYSVVLDETIGTADHLTVKWSDFDTPKLEWTFSWNIGTRTSYNIKLEEAEYYPSPSVTTVLDGSQCHPSSGVDAATVTDFEEYRRVNQRLGGLTLLGHDKLGKK